MFKIMKIKNGQDDQDDQNYQDGLIQVKEEGWTGFSEGLQGCSERFPESKARGKSRGAALPARGKPCPS